MNMIDDIIKDFYENYEANYEFESQSGLDVSFNKDKLPFNYITNNNDFKIFIKECLKRDESYHINETFLIGTWEQTSKAKASVKIDQRINTTIANNYCTKFNINSKYWNVEFNMTDIENNEGWQYLITFVYSYKYFDEIKQKVGEKMNEEITAEMARKMIAENEKRKKTIKELIKENNKSIKNACKRGERTIVFKDREKWYEDAYIEVHEHFKELGYEIKIYRDGSGYYLTW